MTLTELRERLGRLNNGNTISFERVREIAKACREWQQDGKAVERVTCHVAVSETNNKPGWVQQEPLTPGMYQGWRDAKMREVLPGEDEL